MKKVLPHFSFLTRAKPSTDSDWDGARIILTHEGKQRASESTRERERECVVTWKGSRANELHECVSCVHVCRPRYLHRASLLRCVSRELMPM